METMEQFSHDLTLALEETSRTGGVRDGRWGVRRRTRSTGNLPSAPQPTEDSSSSPTDAPNDIQNNQNQDGLTNSVLSDSDDRHDLRLSFKTRPMGNFESDSLNENFSPARFFRSNTRRKRKFKRMAVEYETTPSTPGTTADGGAGGVGGSVSGVGGGGGGIGGTSGTTNSMFPITGAAKKRVLKHTTQENFRTNLFFCGKRKRSHRDRYYDHDHSKLHSSSVPRQRDIFAPKNCYQEHKTRTRSFSTATKPTCDRILPLNKSIVSKIEKISQQQRTTESPTRTTTTAGATFTTAFTFAPILLTSSSSSSVVVVNDMNIKNQLSNDTSTRICDKISELNTPLLGQVIPENVAVRHHHHHHHHHHQPTQKSGSFESTFTPIQPISGSNVISSIDINDKKHTMNSIESDAVRPRRKHKHNRLKREQIRAQLQFDDPNSMDCGGLNEFLSSSSLSSSDSEGGETNESDREGDDELTDWPGNEVMINFASKNDFKRRSTKKSNLPLIKSDDYAPGGDDDTLMSGDEVISPPAGVNFPLPLLTKSIPTQPIAITNTLPGGSGGIGIICGGGVGGCGVNDGNGDSGNISNAQQFRFPVKQIESEMSGETSNTFLSSPPPCQPGEIREIRAGCRRIREERPGFSIVTSINERLARFLQDPKQSQLRLPDIEVHEHENLHSLAKLYHLLLRVENGCVVLTKTSDTTQSVKIDQPNFGNRFFLSDYKRRCYDGRSGGIGTGSCNIQLSDNHHHHHHNIINTIHLNNDTQLAISNDHTTTSLPATSTTTTATTPESCSMTS